MDDADKIKGLATNLKADGFSMTSGTDGTIALDGSTKPTPASEATNDSQRFSMQVAGASRHFNGHGRHVKGYNEINPGVGVGVDVSENTTAFATIYKNSYNDTTVIAGANYAPLHVQEGDMKASLGVTAGIAYTENSSYVKAGPR